MNNSIDQQFIEFVVKSLVSKPEAVVVERRIDEKGVLLELTVDPEDLGRVIGKRGATAQSLRTLLRALGTKNEARYNLKIVDNGELGAASDTTDDVAAAVDDTATTDTPSNLGDLGQDDDIKLDHPADAGSEDRMSRHRRELAELDDLDV